MPLPKVVFHLEGRYSLLAVIWAVGLIVASLALITHQPGNILESTLVVCFALPTFLTIFLLSQD